MNHHADGRSASELILPSVLFDENWYAREAGTTFRDRASAVAHYVAGAGEGGSPHPLFSAEWVFPSSGWRTRGTDPLSCYLTSAKRFERAPHPLLHLPRIAEADPRALEHPLGPADHWLRNAAAEQILPSPRGALPLTLADLWNRLQRARPVAVAGATETAVGRISVVLPLLARPLTAVEWLFGTFREHPDLDVEVLVVVPAQSPFAQLIADVTCAVRRARVVPVEPGAGWAAAANRGLAEATGDVVVFLSTTVRSPYWPWIEQLRAGLADGVGAVQPLLLAEDLSGASAGATFLSGGLDRTALLAGHAAQDAERLPAGRVPGVTGVLAVRTADARFLNGLDEVAADNLAVTDLGVRAWRQGLGGAAVASRSQLVLRDELPLDDEFRLLRGRLPPGSAEAWLAADFEARVGTDGVVHAQPAGLERVVEGPPRLRWTLDLPVTGGPWGRVWGDWYFGEALARALERLGQHVTLDPRESRGRATRDHDDVVLVVRGRDRVIPQGSPLHALWVISHPDDVTVEETAAFDLVFAASEPWAASRSREWGVDVRPLLQCTDPELFHPGLAEPGGHPLLFVGNARGSVRPAVAAALEAGLCPAIYGSGWDGLVDPELVIAEHVDNAELGRLYASADVVLNDHWDDMRRHGFISNRVFDVVACGTGLVSDEVDTLEAHVSDRVRTFRTPAELRTAVTELQGGLRGGGARQRWTSPVNTFTSRAQALVTTVVQTRARH